MKTGEVKKQATIIATKILAAKWMRGELTLSQAFDCAEWMTIKLSRWMPVLVGPETHKCCLCGSVVFKSAKTQMQVEDLPPDSHFEYAGNTYLRGNGIYCTCLGRANGLGGECGASGIEMGTLVKPRPDLDANVTDQEAFNKYAREPDFPNT